VNASGDLITIRRGMRSRVLALLGGLLLLLLPAAALAQSAGDEQYSDPLAGKSPSSQSPSNQSPSNQGSSPSGSVPSGSPSFRDPGQLASGGSQGSSAGDTGAGGPLPRTGLETWMFAVLGGLALLAGVLLRLGLRPLTTRAAGMPPPTLGRDVRLKRSPRRRH
jgi:hypothetical protein